MARIVFAPIPFSGHVNPGLPIVEALVRQGHEVRAYVTPRFKDKAESAGAAYLPYTKATVLDESDLERHFPERSKLKGIRQLKYDIKHVFLDQIPTLLADLVEELERKPADLILGDSLSGVCPLVRQRCGPKWVAYGRFRAPVLEPRHRAVRPGQAAAAGCAGPNAQRGPRSEERRVGKE